MSYNTKTQWHTVAAVSASMVVALVGSTVFVNMHTGAPSTASLYATTMTSSTVGSVRTGARVGAVPVARPSVPVARAVNVDAPETEVEVERSAFDKYTVPTAIGAAATAFTSGPAAALVDERLNGDGTGLAFGINDGALFFVMAGVFTFVWALWATAAQNRSIGDFDDEDSGLQQGP